MISAKRIAEAKTELGLVKPFHEHDDCIYITYQWLDAQRKLKGLANKRIALKHVIENWGGRYVSQSDVEIAAFLHPEIRGTYPYFNLAHRLTLPGRTAVVGYWHGSNPAIRT